MTRHELYSKVGEIVAEVTGAKVTKKVAREITDRVFGEILEDLKKDRDVVLPGIGKIKVVNRAARTARVPQTGEEIKVPAHKTLKLTLSKGIKEVINS